MRRILSQLNWCCLIGGLLLMQALPATAEWYVGGYGGYSLPQSLKNVTMNNYGYQSAVDRYSFTQTDRLLGSQLTQDFKTSDLKLDSSPIFGGKAGYFFNDQGFSWLGVETEVFTTEPSIKQQRVDTTQDIVFTTPFQPGAICAPPPSKACSSQESLNGTRDITKSSLRVITFAFNAVARYPGKTFQPYASVGVGAFYFIGSGMFEGRQIVPGLNAAVGSKWLITRDWGLFFEGKYNLAGLNSLDGANGLTGTYSIFHLVGGVAYHF
jgi:hypothetical protein